MSTHNSTELSVLKEEVPVVYTPRSPANEAESRVSSVYPSQDVMSVDHIGDLGSVSTGIAELQPQPLGPVPQYGHFSCTTLDPAATYAEFATPFPIEASLPMWDGNCSDALREEIDKHNMTRVELGNAHHERAAALSMAQHWQTKYTRSEAGRAGCEAELERSESELRNMEEELRQAVAEIDQLYKQVDSYESRVCRYPALMRDATDHLSFAQTTVVPSLNSLRVPARSLAPPRPLIVLPPQVNEPDMCISHQVLYVVLAGGGKL